MNQSRPPTFKCAACGKSYVWRKDSAGKVRVCNCGEFIPIPLESPPVEAPVEGAAAPSQSVAAQGAATLGNPPRAASASESVAAWEAYNEAEAARVSGIAASNVAGSNGSPAPPANAAPAPPEDEYAIKEPGARLRARKASIKSIDSNGTIDLDTPHVSTAFLADARQRRVRQQHAVGSLMREWVAPCLLIFIATIVNAYQIQRHLRILNEEPNLGRLLTLYLSVNAMSMASGILLVWLLAKVEFGRFITSLLKWIAITLVTPAVWLGVVDAFLMYDIGGKSPFGMLVGWVLDVAVGYALFASLFDLDPLDLFWSVSAINFIKIIFFTCIYLLRTHI